MIPHNDRYAMFICKYKPFRLYFYFKFMFMLKFTTSTIQKTLRVLIYL